MRMPLGSRICAIHARNKKYNKQVKYIFFAFLIFLFFFLLGSLYQRLVQSAKTLGTNSAKSASIRAINEVISDEIKSGEFSYDAFVSLRENIGGQIVAAELNVLKTNQLKASLSEKIHNKISSLEEIPIKIPFGNITDNILLSGYGPRIPLRLIPHGYATVNIKSNFSSAGINQTKHEIFLEITTTVHAVMPMDSSPVTVSCTVPVAETIIVGTVPNVYTNIDGVNLSARQ